MTLDPANNLAETELTASVSDTTTTLPVADASVFPDADTEGAFNVLVWDSEANINPVDAPDAEFVRVTSVDTTADELTVQRGQEDTPASAKASGSTVTDTWSVKDRDDIDSALNGKADDPHGSESHTEEVVHEGEDATLGDTTHDSVDTGEYQGAIAIGAVVTPASASGDDAVGIGDDAEASGSSATALGRDAEALSEGDIAIGNGVVVDGNGFNGVGVGAGAEATDSSAIAIGSSSEATENSSVAIGVNAIAAGGTAGRTVAIGRAAEALNGNEGVLGNDNETDDWIVPGDFTVQGSKDFEIDHPSKPETHNLRHGAYEGPVPGGLIYNATVTADAERVDLDGYLPGYVINGDFGTDWTCHVTASDHFGRGYVDPDEWVLVVEEPGDYEVTIFGERDDDAATRNGKHRTEKPKGERWNGEPRTYYRDHPRFDADGYDDILNVRQKFEHTEDCSPEPCEEAFAGWSVSIETEDGQREKMPGVKMDADLDVVIGAARAKIEHDPSPED